MSYALKKYRSSTPFISFNPRGLNLPRVPLFGLAGSGKTVFTGGLLMANEDKANYGTNFFTDCDEGGSDIRLAADQLKIGRFPDKTPKGLLFESVIYFKWKLYRGLKWVEVCAPIIDPSGEDIKEIIDKYNNKMYTPNLNVKSDLSNLQKYILDCDAAILIMDVTRAKGVFDKGLSVDATYKGNPDREAARVLEAMMNYKAKEKHSRKLKRVFIGLTKADAIKDYLPPHMNLEDEEGRKEFVARCFPHTWSKLMYRNIPSVVLPVWFYVLKDEEDQPVLWEDDQTPVIAMDANTGRPHYSFGTFHIVSEWLKSVAR